MLVVLFATCSSVQSNSRTLYVRANGTQCPPTIATSECQTLDWYSKNSGSSFISNTRMVFLEGLHFLNNFIDVSNCNNFSMIGSKTHRSNQLPQPTSQIICTEASKTGFSFINSNKIRITDLTLDSCSGMVALKQGLNVPVALAFAQVTDLALYHVVINNTVGNGLYCYNCVGEISVSESAFVNAKVDGKKLCSSNANFWFDNPCSSYKTSFRIDNSWIMYGLNNESKSYNASGLQFSIFCPRIQVNINSISAYGNIGSSGGNIGISITDFGSDTSTVAISNSTISNGSAVEGGGIKFWSSVESSESTTGESDRFSDILSISNTKFQNNVARSTSDGTAIYVTYHEHYTSSDLKSRRISIINCTFIQNNAAMAIVKPVIPDYSSRNLTVYINGCTFRHNGDRRSSLVKLVGVKHVLLANCNFTENYGSALYLRSSNLHFFGMVDFESNSALYGGAIKMDDSSVTYLHEGSYVLFVNNTANKGGAIFAQESFEKILPPCILQPIAYSSESVHDLIEVKFVNNSASHGGDAIYGGSLDYCYNSADERISNKSFNKTFTFLDMSKQKGTSTISSDPSGVFFCEKDGSCKGVTANITIFPGQSFNVSVTTFGQLYGTTDGAIDAIIVDNSYSTLNELSTKQCSNEQKGCVRILTHTLCSNESSVTINFTVVTANMNTHRVHINASLNVSLSTCPFGFALTETPPYRCDCSPVFTAWPLKSQCDINTEVIQSRVFPVVWVGCEKHAMFKNESVCYISVAHSCNVYCNNKEHSITITKGNVSDDQQCLPGRTGILCGACKPGLSRILGSFTKCQLCSNKNLPFLLPLFLLSGWLLIIFLTALNMTVSEGTINGLIVYANAIYAYRHLTPNDSQVNRILWSFIAWLNLDVGIEVCFYNGMDSYQLMWLQYGYAFYLIALQVLIVFLCRKFVLFTRLFGKNVLQVLATLLFLGYSPLMHAIVNTFSRAPLRVHFSNNTILEERHILIYDGNISYFEAKHIPMFILGIVCIVTMLFFTLSLLLNQCLQRRSNIFCLRWIEKWRPFFEVYTGPCRDNCRFWPGFLLVMRIFFIEFITYSNSSNGDKSLQTIGFSVLLMSFLCIFPHGMYKKWALNVLEFSFFLNLSITSILLLSGAKHHLEAVFHTSVLIAMFTFGGIVIYHVCVRLKIKSLCIKHVKPKPRALELINKIHNKQHVALCCFKSESGDHDEIARLVSSHKEDFQYE